MNELYISIIIPTLGRKQELKSLLESIRKTKLKYRFETLVIDQNQDGLIDDVCKEYEQELALTQYRVEFKGLSRAKNYGIDHASGTVLCFPDDDAELTENTIFEAIRLLKEKDVDCVFGKCVDKATGHDSVTVFTDQEKALSIDDFESAFVEATMFAKKSMFNYGRYDEKMGVGTIFGSQEGYDLVYRLLKKGMKMYYSPSIVFYHPNKVDSRTTAAEVNRAFYYSCGLGYLCRKHGFKGKYKARERKLMMGIPVIAVIRRQELKYYQAQLMGLRLGYEYLS